MFPCLHTSPYDGLDIAQEWILESCIESAESLWAWRTAERIILNKSHFCFMDLYSVCQFCDELAEQNDVIKESIQFYRAEIRDCCYFTRVSKHINAASERPLRRARRAWTSQALVGSTEAEASSDTHPSERIRCSTGRTPSARGPTPPSHRKNRQ